MKVIGISGSARKDGNTALIIRAVFEELEAEGIRTELVQLAGKPMDGCRACYGCKGKGPVSSRMTFSTTVLPGWWRRTVSSSVLPSTRRTSPRS